MPQVTRFRVISAAVAAGAMTLSGLTMTAAAQASQRPAIAGTHPAWAVPANLATRRAVTSGTVNARVYLAGRDQAGLTAYATAVSTPGSASYGHYLSAAQVRARFGPTATQVAAVESWLRSAGLRVTGAVGQVAGYVSVRGSVAAARKAFSVSFGKFRAPNGKAYRAPEQAASAPASVAGDVLTISGLDTAPHMMKPQLPPPGANYWVAPPCGHYYSQKTSTRLPRAYGRHWPWNVCGYTPRQIRSAYGVARSGMTGRGQTVAIVDAYASPTMRRDANTFSRVTGDKPFRPGQYSQHLMRPFTLAGPTECGAPGWYGEETLDVEAVHGEAQNANVRFVGAASCQDSDLANADAWVVDHDAASIVSNSWGEPADDAILIPVFDVIFKAGAAEGIGFFFSSGDSGYESSAEDPGSDKIQVDFPTSSPWVTSVGGTSLAIGRGGRYEFETSWGTIIDPLNAAGTAWQHRPPGQYPAGYDGSSGGGTSTYYRQPSYQRGVVPYRLSHAIPGGGHSRTAMRVIPDVSALADPSTGMLVGQTVLLANGKTYGFALSRIGGTSVASPVFAGIEADAQQAAGHRLGFANPVIYRRHGTRAFHDVTYRGRLAQIRNNYTNGATRQRPLITFLRTLGIDGEGAAALRATRGYDDATGLGSPRYYIQSFHHRR